MGVKIQSTRVKVLIVHYLPGNRRCPPIAFDDNGCGGLVYRYQTGILIQGEADGNNACCNDHPLVFQQNIVVIGKVSGVILPVYYFVYFA